MVCYEVADRLSIGMVGTIVTELGVWGAPHTGGAEARERRGVWGWLLVVSGGGLAYSQ